LPPQRKGARIGANLPRTLQLAPHGNKLIQILIKHQLAMTDTIQIEIIMPNFKKILLKSIRSTLL
jgi:hypothetical protein